MDFFSQEFIATVNHCVNFWQLDGPPDIAIVIIRAKLRSISAIPRKHKILIFLSEMLWQLLVKRKTSFLPHSQSNRDTVKIAKILSKLQELFTVLFQGTEMSQRYDV